VNRRKSCELIVSLLIEAARAIERRAISAEAGHLARIDRWQECCSQLLTLEASTYSLGKGKCYSFNTPTGLQTQWHPLNLTSIIVAGLFVSVSCFIAARFIPKPVLLVLD